MKYFDITTDINQDTYQDEYKLFIIEDSSKTIINLDTAELLDLYNEVQHTVETNIV